MKKLKVIYCPFEENLNNFLNTIDVNKIHRIMYIPKPSGTQTEKSLNIDTGITAIVEYFVEE